MSMKCLVLGGGGPKIADQVGRLRALAATGWEPTAIYGTSCGALLGFLVQAGWMLDGSFQRGVDFAWHYLWSEVDGPRTFARPYSKLSLLWVALRRRGYRGLADPAPLVARLDALDRKVRQLARHRAAPLFVGVYDLAFDRVEYLPGTARWVLASALDPSLFAPLDGRYWDGGLKDVAPLKPAVEAGADEITAIVTQPRSIARHLRSGDPWWLLGAALSSITTELVEGDLRFDRDLAKFDDANRVATTPGVLCSKRYIPRRVLRPTRPVRLSLTSFTRMEFRDAMIEGEREGRQQLPDGVV